MGLHNQKYGFAQPKVWVCNSSKTRKFFILHNQKYGFLSDYTTEIRIGCVKKENFINKRLCFKGLYKRKNKKRITNKKNSCEKIKKGVQ